MNYKNIYLLFILVISVIFFSVIGCTDVEGMNDDETTEELAVPVCNANNEICKDDMFMLKTSAIPPVCPSCPPYVASNTLDEGSPDAGSGTETSSWGSKSEIKSYIDSLMGTNSASASGNSASASGNANATNVKQKSSINTNEKNNVTYNIDNSIQERSIDIGSSSGNTTSDNMPSMPSGNNMSFGNNALPGSIYTNDAQELQLLRAELAELKKNGGDRPCPACERCPEPAFDCKKVPNYRSTAVDNYMPLPVLNDFSTF
jgi:hypothetical protein